MRITNINVEKYLSLTKIITDLNVGDEVEIPEEVASPYKVRAVLCELKRRKGLVFTGTTRNITSGILVTRIS